MRKRLKKVEGLSKKTKYSKAVPLFLFGFLGFAILRTIGDGIIAIPRPQWQWLVQHINELGKFLVLIAMAGIGLNTKFSTMRQIGLKPFVLGLVASIFLALMSLLLINLLGIT